MTVTKLEALADEVSCLRRGDEGWVEAARLYDMLAELVEATDAARARSWVDVDTTHAFLTALGKARARLVISAARAAE
jgi:hypothetical protein